MLDERIPSLVGRILSLVSVSRHGLSEAELLGALGLPRAIASPLLRALQESLLSSSGSLVCHHSALEQAISERYLNQPLQTSAAHSLLADYFEKFPSADPRRLSELPYQLLLAGDHSRLRSLLTSINTIQALTSTDSGRLELAEYWRALGLSDAGRYYEVN